MGYEKTATDLPSPGRNYGCAWGRKFSQIQGAWEASCGTKLGIVQLRNVKRLLKTVSERGCNVSFRHREGFSDAYATE